MGKYFNIHGTALRPIDRLAALVVATALLLLLALLVGGCGEQVTMYQVQGTCVSTTQRVLVMPFMDTRTFTDSNDPHRENLGEHARDIYVQAMRDNPVLNGSIIMTPVLPKQSRSLTNAEVAEIGRQHGADVVVAGQVFSFTGTRAASIPPRAGMFVRVVSAADGAILFVGDDYQAAAVPGAPGGRDLQARNVADRLIDGMVRQGKPLAFRKDRRISSSTAYAMLPPPGKRPRFANKAESGGSGGKDRDKVPEFEPIPEAPPFLGFSGGIMDPTTWDDQVVPEVPPIIDFNVGADFSAPPAATVAEAGEEPLPLPPPPGMEFEDEELPEQAENKIETETNERALATETSEKAASNDVVMAETTLEEPVATAITVTELPDEISDGSDIATSTDDAEESAPAIANAMANTEPEPEFIPTDAHISGDDLAADLFAADGEVWIAESRPASVTTAAVIDMAPLSTPTIGQPERILESYEPYLFVEAGAMPSAESPVAEVSGALTDYSASQGYISESEIELALSGGNDGPIYSIPLAVEQPRTFKAADLVELTDEPADTRPDANARVTALSQAVTNTDAIRILVLPYHDRENENNLITNTGGGEVVTTLYGTQLAADPSIRVMWDATGQATHDRLVDRNEAVQLGKMVGADYVVRGQVVEFRRAQSVPSFYSAVISTAVLAAQMFFAEMSGVDVATEVYRVSDGACVMSRRDRAQQKYVVQSEKTVRKLAAGMAKGVIGVVKSANPEEMDPLIDTLEPVTVFSNPK